jgi:hypothetical protein
VCSTLNAEVEAFIKLNTPGPQLCSVILYIGAYYGVSYPMGWFRLSASFDTTVLHIARCVVYSMQACKDGTLGSPQLVVHSLTTDSHSDATPEMVWRRLWRTFSSGDRVKLAVRD